jgi:hypothetical protein
MDVNELMKYKADRDAGLFIMCRIMIMN